MKYYAIFARSLVGVMLIAVWGLTDSPLSGVAFLLILTAVSAARYRFKALSRFAVTGTLEIVACIGFAFLWFPALLGLWLPVIGFIEDKWQGWERDLLLKDFEDRAERLKLEKKRENASMELRYAARVAEINERSRIAQDIHDHVGHEITGALIALQTAAKLYESGDGRAGELLGQTIKCLESASENLRETVHNLKPAKGTALSYLEEICDSFKFCEARFEVSGDLNNITHFELLAANLKEALTNVSRHSNADSVTVRLDGNADYIRMTVSDNGTKLKTLKSKSGMGLSGMKERIRAAGGTLTVIYENGFKIICILPKKSQEGI
ncbi:MAG: sensor histidine kinase [Oscillospiraceae bacterium]|nr:sensor histidine kinase [Oscillospiraceae bacterium]